MKELLYNFYTTSGKSPHMSGGGGPLGFDIQYALEIDYLLNIYKCDVIIETGTHLGDSTEYFAKQYPNITIISSEINKEFFDYSSKRLDHYPNVHLYNESSEKTLLKLQNTFFLPFYYLDAHWYDYWPLSDELSHINTGIVNISDFNINNKNFGFDSYGGKQCNIDIIPKSSNTSPIYINNINSEIFPIIPTIRRCGRAYFAKNYPHDKFECSKLFTKI